MSGIGVVTNPRSRRNRRNPALVQRLAYILGDKGKLAQPDNADQMDDISKVFLEREIDVLCINGGDGTGQVVLSSMCRVYGDRPLPKIALLRGGTMNTVASGLGIKGQPSEILSRVVSMYHEGEPFEIAERSLLCVDNRYYGFLFGNGLISNFLELYYEGSEPTPLKAFWLLLRAVSSTLIQGPLIKRLLTPVQAEVRIDDHLIEQKKFLAIAAATVTSFGFGFQVCPRVVKHPGMLEAVAFHCSPKTVITQLPRMKRGLPINSEDITDMLATSMKIVAERPISFQLDGDFIQGGQVVEVTMGPKVQMII